MDFVSGNDAGGISREGDFQKWFIVRIRERILQWNRRRQLAVLHDKADESFHFLNIELKFGSMKDFPVFRQNPGIIQNDQAPR
jgi:hypothetical protein